jgi:arylsulfatase A-like enzyme
MHFEDGSWLHKLSEANLGARIHNLLARMHLLHDVLGRQDAQAITSHALRWIDSGSQPFFITMNLFDVHEPFMPPPEYFHRFSQRTKPLDQFYWPQDVQLSPQQIQDEIDAYDGCIAYTDDQIAAFMGQLRRRGVLDHTIVIVTSDHGEEFQEHGFMFHSKGLYWELIHAPLILYAPGNAAVPPAARIVTPVALQSLPATMLHLARASVNRFPGPSLDPLWSARSPANWPYPVSELASFGTSPLFPSYFGPLKSIVTAKWHYIEGGKFGEELYPCCGNEVSNQAASAGGKLMAQDLRQILGSTESPRVGIAASAIQQNVPARPVLNPKQLAADRQKMNDQLRALGYTPDLL